MIEEFVGIMMIFRIGRIKHTGTVINLIGFKIKTQNIDVSLTNSNQFDSGCVLEIIIFIILWLLF